MARPSTSSSPRPRPKRTRRTKATTLAGNIEADAVLDAWNRDNPALLSGMRFRKGSEQRERLKYWDYFLYWCNVRIRKQAEAA